MSAPPQSLLDALSELGLEDWIPVPEAVHSPEIAAAASDSDDLGAAVARALSSLVRSGQVRIFRGRALSVPPKPLTADEACELLRDPYWREWGREGNEERLFFAHTAAANRWEEAE